MSDFEVSVHKRQPDDEGMCTHCLIAVKISETFGKARIVRLHYCY